MVSNDSPTLEQIRCRNLKRFRDETDVLETDVPLPSLDATHVTSVQTGSSRELFLTPTSDLPKLTHAKAKERFDIWLEHKGELLQLTAMFPRPISTQSLSTFCGKGEDESGPITKSDSDPVTSAPEDVL